MASPSDTQDRNVTSRRAGAADAVAWVALCLLTLASFGSHGLDLGALGTAIALGIAVVKACIVLFAFMHLAHESVSIRFLVLLAALWVVLVCAGIVLDVAFR